MQSRSKTRRKESGKQQIELRNSYGSQMPIEYSVVAVHAYRNNDSKHGIQALLAYLDLG